VAINQFGRNWNAAAPLYRSNLFGFSGRSGPSAFAATITAAAAIRSIPSGSFNGTLQPTSPKASAHHSVRFGTALALAITGGKNRATMAVMLS
jgi:hypothetical protein